MALSEEQIIDLFNEACRETFNGLERFRHFAHAVEAEVRKQDDALIQQLVEALEHIHRCIPMGGFAQIHWDSASFEQIVQAAEAGRARLEGKQ